MDAESPGLLRDLWQAFRRVLGQTRRPETAELGAFFGDEILGNGVGWSAGLASGWLVDHLFVRRGLRNLWGLAPAERMVVSGDRYELIGTVASYTVGLVTLIVVRHFLVGTMHELSALRAERTRPPAPDPAPAPEAVPGSNRG